jgi:hypothetical protein
MSLCDQGRDLASLPLVEEVYSLLVAIGGLSGGVRNYHFQLIKIEVQSAHTFNQAMGFFQNRTNFFFRIEFLGVIWLSFHNLVGSWLSNKIMLLYWNSCWQLHN